MMWDFESQCLGSNPSKIKSLLFKALLWILNSRVKSAKAFLAQLDLEQHICNV